MYYILYEGLKIESNEPVYCTLYIVQCTVYTVQCTKYIVHSTLCTVRCTLYTVRFTSAHVCSVCSTL